MFVDSDHEGDQCTQRSCTSFLMYLDTALITWCLKRQSMLATSTFGTEIVDMKTGVEILQGIHFEIDLMGIPIDGATYIYGDSMCIINNTSKPESN